MKIFNYTNREDAYLSFTRKQWSSFKKNIDIDITEDDLKPLIGFQENLDLEEVSTIYLPIVRLLNYYYEAHINRLGTMQKFLELDKDSVKPTPFIISITGAVSVGKSTVSRMLKFLLENWPIKRTVEVVTTDGFLYPLKYLKKHDLLSKKGFPESYNTAKLIKFISDVKSGLPGYSNIYSHITYDIVPEQKIKIHNPDILILEGLNVLQTGITKDSSYNIFVSDFVDFSIYVDASIDLLQDWYVARFLTFRKTSFTHKDSYFKHYTDLSEEEAKKIAVDIWKSINEKNLLENIMPTKERASLIMKKGKDHKIEKIKLRR